MSHFYRGEPEIDPWNEPEHDDTPHSFLCACGEDGCIGWDDDPQNVRVGKAWYAADCRHKPLAIVEDQDRAFRTDERHGK